MTPIFLGLVRRGQVRREPETKLVPVLEVILLQLCNQGGVLECGQVEQNRDFKAQCVGQVLLPSEDLQMRRWSFGAVNQIEYQEDLLWRVGRQSQATVLG